MENDSAEYTYPSRQRTRILAAFGRRDVRADTLMDDLSRAASSAVSAHQSPFANRTGRVEGLEQLARLRHAVNALTPDVRAWLEYGLDHYQTEIGTRITLDEVVGIAQELEAAWPDFCADRGRPPNEAANDFLRRCCVIWSRHGRKLPAKKVKKDSPICRFAKAAMPREVLPNADGWQDADISTRVNAVLRRAHWMLEMPDPHRRQPACDAAD